MKVETPVRAMRTKCLECTNWSEHARCRIVPDDRLRFMALSTRCDAIINFGNRIRIKDTVFHDVLRYRDLIERGIAPRYEEGRNYEGQQIREL